MKILLNRLKMVSVVILLALLALVGCGGSGSATSQLNLFATDNLHPGYSGVWVKLFKVDLTNSTGVKVNVFNSADGVTVNLRDLNDGSAKFLLLAPERVPNGTYTKVTFEMDKSVTLVAKPSGTVSTANFPNSLDAIVAGHSDLSVDFAPNLIVPGTPNLTIDFDLQNWDVSGGIVTPVLHRHDGNGMNDPSRHHRFEFRGIISGLSGASPDQTFSLSLKTGGSVNVASNDTTQVVIDNGATELSNGQNVHVFGAFNPLTNVIDAKIIRVDSDVQTEAEVVGTISNPNNVAKTFTLAPQCTEGFIPQGESVTIQTNGTTKFRGSHGALLTEIEFYAALAIAGPNAIAEVEGSFDINSNTLTATAVHFETEAEFGEDEAKGTTSAVDDVAGTFDMTVTESDGFDLPNGPLHIAVSSNAEFRNNNGQTMTKLEFFTTILANPKIVEVKGAFNAGLFTASRLRLKN